MICSCQSARFFPQSARFLPKSQTKTNRLRVLCFDNRSSPTKIAIHSGLLRGKQPNKRNPFLHAFHSVRGSPTPAGGSKMEGETECGGHKKPSKWTIEALGNPAPPHLAECPIFGVNQNDLLLAILRVVHSHKFDLKKQANFVRRFLDLFFCQAS